jgi:hypothetical protein
VDYGLFSQNSGGNNIKNKCMDNENEIIHAYIHIATDYIVHA